MPESPPRPRARLSAVILARDEADRIGDCLRSVAFCDEVLVVDSLSTDGTAELAERLGARVLRRAWPGYRSQREYAVGAASHDWILSIDADERVTPQLRRELEALRERGFEPHAGWEYPRSLHYLGAFLRHGTPTPDRAVRLFDRRRTHYAGFEVHERLVVGGTVGRLQGAVEHYSYRGYDDHVERMQRYARLWAEQAHAAGRRARLLNVYANPAWRFLRGYLGRQGFRDGWRGLVFHVVEAGYVRQKYLRLYLLERLAPQRAGAGGPSSGVIEGAPAARR